MRLPSADAVLARLARSDLGRQILAEQDAERSAEHAKAVAELQAAEAAFLKARGPAHEAVRRAEAALKAAEQAVEDARREYSRAFSARSTVADAFEVQRQRLDPVLRAAAHPDLAEWREELEQRLKSAPQPTVLYAGQLGPVRFNNFAECDRYARAVLEAQDEATNRLHLLPEPEALKAIRARREALEELKASIPRP